MSDQARNQPLEKPVASEVKELNHAILEIYLSEYKVLREEFQFFHDARERLLNYVIVAIVALPTVIFGLIQTRIAIDSVGLLLLILPLPFIAVCTAYVGYMRNQISIARYTYRLLAPEMKQVVGPAQDPRFAHLMGWGDYWDARSAFNNTARATGEFLVLILPIFGSLIGFTILVVQGLSSWHMEYLALITLDVLGTLGVAILLWLSVRLD